jgi:hypothetical protein
LNGARPGDVPIEQPTIFELQVSPKTAKQLDLAIPQSFLLRADKVIHQRLVALHTADDSSPRPPANCDQPFRISMGIRPHLSVLGQLQSAHSEGHMSTSRREFLIASSATMLGTTTPANAQTLTGTDKQNPAEPTPGSPPAFGTATPIGPEVSPATFAEAEKLAQVSMTEKDRAQAAQNWRNSMAALYERRTGPRKLELGPALVPYSQWNPVLPGHKGIPKRNRFVRSSTETGPLPSNDAEIALAPVWKPTSNWLTSSASIPSCVASSPLLAISRWHRRRKPIGKSHRGSIAVRCTESRGRARTFLILRASSLRTERGPSSAVCRRMMLRLCDVSTRLALCLSPN